MAAKQTGYEFWHNILKSPKYVAAPMVDMSELSFRMLCRRYKAQLCFSPMLHSQQFLQDVLYRSDTFSTCPEDNPLIVQFCSNDPIDFINAASLVTSQCCAVDLNLGCPQAIAKKGHYGAFLQDDWDLIHSIVRKASTDLQIPVTCKMRILPGDHRKSVEYAKMLEGSGCSVLTVHGRTREQKGHATGLASWDVIKTIKANVNIPVIANGNILSYYDIKDCLEFTGADAVMSAETLLHNPALFTGKNPPVWSIVEEYLQFAEKYKTPLRIVRCHLFKILYLCIHQNKDIQEILAEGKAYADFYAVCDLLKLLPKTCVNVSNEKSNNVNDFDFVSNLNYLYDEERTNCLLNTIDNITVSKPNEEIMCDKIKKHLPIWLCHSRPRVVDEKDFINTTRGSYSKYFEPVVQTKDSSLDEVFMSKKRLRKLRRYERVVAAKKEKRKTQRMRKKMKQIKEIELRQESVIDKDSNSDCIKTTKKEKKLQIKERLLQAQGFAPRVCIDLGFVADMDSKDLTRLSCQLRRLYGSNRHSLSPLHLYFCNFSKSSDLYQICLAKNDGFASYVVEMSEKPPEEVFEHEKIIFLSPDSENVLTTLDHDKIYVIGGIIDANVKKGLSVSHAKQYNIQTARLPITENLVKFSPNPGNTVLTVNQVFDILLKFYETSDWIQALSRNVPLRKGYCAPTSQKELLGIGSVCS